MGGLVAADRLRGGGCSWMANPLPLLDDEANADIGRCGGFAAGVVGVLADDADGPARVCDEASFIRSKNEFAEEDERLVKFHSKGDGMMRV